MEYEKPALSIEEQLELLEEKGLVIDGYARARHYLNHISYYRLSAYTLPFKQKIGGAGRFEDGTTFVDILNLYLFDRQVKLLLFDAIERIEVVVKAQLVNHLSAAHGPHWLSNGNLFRNEAIRLELCASVQDECRRSKEPFIQHYFRKYGSPTLPPSWMSIEILSLGKISRLYDNLVGPERQAIARHFGLEVTIFESWLHTVSFVRNVCAHHARMWNRVLGVRPRIPLKPPAHPWINTHGIPHDRPYIAFAIIGYFMDVINPKSRYKKRLQELFAAAPVFYQRGAGVQPLHFADAFWTQPGRT